MDRVAKRVRVHGTVQGVAFRWYTKELARELGLAGWVQNLDDGSVEVWAEGPPSAVDELVRWLAHGPPAARVANVEVVDETPAGGSRFEVRR